MDREGCQQQARFIQQQPLSQGLAEALGTLLSGPFLEPRLPPEVRWHCVPICP